MMLTKERHYKALGETLEHLKGYINVKLPVDARCEELREAITEFGSITGRVDT
jgi:tRNA U34 5-carboxymethylaminomethyl modifying GTPase MnmE/TrmE